MKVDNKDLSDEDIVYIKQCVKERKPIDFFCYTLTPDQKIRFQKILSVFLQECNQMHLYNYLSKRIFFKENNLDINNENDYKNGMKSFRETLIENTSHYEEKLEEGELRVHLLLTANDIISVTVTNNTKITDSEYARIQDKIERTKIYQTMADAMADIDQTEGSGLGIITVLVMLKKLGLDAQHLHFDTSDTETVATIEIHKDSMEEI